MLRATSLESRKPRSTSLKDLARWKATELQQFLLCTSPIVLKGIFDAELYEHFTLLHTAIKILIDKELYMEYNSYAYDLLLLFVERAEVLYGVEFVSYNVHGVLHLPSDALRNGPFDTFFFEFENLLQDVKKMLRKHGLPLQQIIRRLVEIGNWNATSKSLLRKKKRRCL